jgi:hypothetical protein
VPLNLKPFMEQLKKYPRIHVTWTDSAGPERYWNHPEDFDTDPTTIETLGWLIHESKKAVTVVSSVSTSGCVGGSMTIPKIAITHREDG